MTLENPVYISSDEPNCVTGPEAMTIRQAPHLGLPGSPSLPLFYLQFGFVDPQFGFRGCHEESLGRMSREDAAKRLANVAEERGFRSV